MRNAARKNEAVTRVVRGARYPKLAKMMVSQRINRVDRPAGCVYHDPAPLYDLSISSRRRFKDIGVP